jgi:[FeFe] hydrogenase H-cluster maturation GTPase HydF
MNSDSIIKLKQEIVERVKQLDSKEMTMIGDIVPYNGKVVMVVPIDSEAPKGRLILPQVQFLRDCLDHGIKCYVTRDTELPSALNELGDIDLVVTDSQAFKEVHEIVPESIKLTSFSIVMSRIKGDLEEFVRSVRKLDDLPDGAKILVAESCTHNSTCEDIGRVKIPRGVGKFTGKKFNYDVMSGRDFPNDLSGYDFVIHCASCMLNRKIMQTRIEMCREAGIPITNYGILLSYINGILDRATKVFNIK